MSIRPLNHPLPTTHLIYHELPVQKYVLAKPIYVVLRVNISKLTLQLEAVVMLQINTT